VSPRARFVALQGPSAAPRRALGDSCDLPEELGDEGAFPTGVAADDAQRLRKDRAEYAVLALPATGSASRSRHVSSRSTD